jgi:hypothetical protein
MLIVGITYCLHYYQNFSGKCGSRYLGFKEKVYINLHRDNTHHGTFNRNQYFWISCFKIAIPLIAKNKQSDLGIIYFQLLKSLIS